MEQTAQQLYDELLQRGKTLDWYYSYSDDHGVYRRGDAAFKKFQTDFKKLKSMDNELAVKLNNECVPKGFDLINR